MLFDILCYFALVYFIIKNNDILFFFVATQYQINELQPSYALFQHSRFSCAPHSSTAQCFDQHCVPSGRSREQHSIRKNRNHRTQERYQCALPCINTNSHIGAPLNAARNLIVFLQNIALCIPVISSSFMVSGNNTGRRSPKIAAFVFSELYNVFCFSQHSKCILWMVAAQGRAGQGIS